MGCANGKKYEEPISPPAKKSTGGPDLEKRPSRVQFMDAAQVIDESAKKKDAHAAVEKKAHLEHTHSSDGAVPKRKNVTAMVKASDLPPEDDDDEDEEGEGEAEPQQTSIVPTPAPAAPKKPADPNAKVKISEESTSVRRTEVDRAINGEDGEDEGEGAEEDGEAAKTPKNPKKRIPTQCGAKLGAFNMDDEDDEDEEEEGDWAGAEEAEDGEKPKD